MQIRAEQILADINIYLEQISAYTSRQRNPVTAESIYDYINVSESTEYRKTENQRQRPIRQVIVDKLAVPPPKLMSLPLEDKILAVKSPFFTKHIIYKVHTKAVYEETVLRQEKSPLRMPYAPLTRFYPEEAYSDLTKAKIDEFGLLQLKQRQDIPVDVDLSPVFELPGANGKAAIYVNSIKNNEMRKKEALSMSPAKKLYSELQLYKFADEGAENYKIKTIIENYQARAVGLNTYTLKHVETPSFEEYYVLKHWSLINSGKIFDTAWINEVIDKNCQQYEMMGLAAGFQTPVFFYDIECYDLAIDKGEVVRNVVYKALMQRYRFAATELTYLLTRLVDLSAGTPQTVLGAQLIDCALRMYFHGERPSEGNYKSIMVNRVADPTFEELYQIEYARERYREYEEQYKRQNEQLRYKIGSALIIQHYARFKRLRKQYLQQIGLKKRDDAAKFASLQERFFVDVLPYYTRFDPLISDSSSSVSRSIDLPLLDCEFWRAMQGKPVEQRVLAVVYVADEFYALFDYLGATYERDNWKPELFDGLMCLLVDPRVHLCVVSLHKLASPRTYILNAIDSISGKLGDAEKRLHYIHVDVDAEFVEMTQNLRIPASRLFFMQLKHNYLRVLGQIQQVVDDVAPDVAFYIITVEYLLSERLVRFAQSVGIPIHQYCPELMHFDAFNHAVEKLVGTPLIRGKLVDSYVGDGSESFEVAVEAPTYLIRPDFMITAPGQDLFYGYVGGIGIYHIIKNKPYTIFQNIPYATFYKQFGCFVQPYYSESGIKAYVSYSSTVHAQKPQFYYNDIMARSYVNFGRTMSAGSYSVVGYDTLLGELNPASLQSFYALVQNALRSKGFRGRFECGILIYKYDGALSFEFNQLAVGYTRRYLSHCKALLYATYMQILRYRESNTLQIRVSDDYYMFVLNMYNEFFASLLHELKAVKLPSAEISVYNGSALDVVISGDNVQQLLYRTNDALTVLQNKSGGEERMRALLGNLDFNSMHQIYSEIERTGTSAFFVCAINTILEQKY